MGSRKVHVTIHGVIEVPEETKLRDLQAKSVPGGREIVVVDTATDQKFSMESKVSYIEEWEGFP